MSNWVSIGSCTEKCLTWSPAAADPDGELSYIDLSSVDKDAKRIEGADRILCMDAPSRARQIVNAGDVLVSTVRPNLNGVAVVPEELNGATASTGFTVLRPAPDVIDGPYLFHWVKTPRFVNEMVRLATGASYPAVSDKIICESKLPLPPLPEQRRIAAILDKADALCAKRREAIAKLDQLLKSVFLEMFGDEAEASTTVADITASASAMRTGPFGSQLLHSEFVDSGIAVLGIDNAVSNQFSWGKPRYITEQKYSKLSRYRVLPSDVLITIMGTCGRCAVAPEDIPLAINTKHLCCITLDRSKCEPEFLHSYFLMHPIARNYLESRAKGAIMSGLNLGIIKELPIALPSIERQLQFVSVKRKLRQQLARSESQLARLDRLFASLQHQAFAGTL